MFMQDRTEGTSSRTGTLHVHLVFGRYRIYAEETFINPRQPATDIKTLTIHLESPYQYSVKSVPYYSGPPRVRIWCPELGIDIRVCPESSTVRALYDGLLVTTWTTAQKTPQHRWSCSAQLATVLVFVTTLTIVGRCYASANAAAPLVQLSPPRPHYNSKLPTSSLVLGRLFIPERFVKSDIRLIRDDYEGLLDRISDVRTKRDFKAAHHNRIANLKNKPTFEENSTTFKNTNAEPFSLRTRKIFGESGDESRLELSVPVEVNVSSSEGGSDILNTTRVLTAGDTEAEPQQNDSSFQEGQELLRTTQRPMPPAHAHDNESSGAVSAFGIILVVVLLTGAVLGLVTCLLSHQWGTGGASGAGTPATHPHHAADSPTTAPMLSVVSAGAAAGMGGMDRLRGGSRAARELAASRDRQVRLHAVHTDIAINLPHSIAMPDGEEHPFTSSRLHIRDAEQESEIYQKCIRPPPNRTVLESESPPPYRSNSAGVLASSSSSSSSSSGSDWSAGSAPLVVRCHSMSSTSKPTSSSCHPQVAGQKTDFLQRTVKIFTGKKAQQHHQPPPAPTLPVVVVPATSRTRRADPSRPKPPPGV